MNASVRLLEQVLPSVVHVRARIPERHPSARILGIERMGSGIAIDRKGLILTVNYVLIGARELVVTLLDSREYPATVVRHDFHSGLGLLRIDADDLPVLPLESSRDLAIGEEIFLVASVGDGQSRVADGNVTYLGPFDANWEYLLERAIVTSAMNPGLGGGPMLDMQGRVRGVLSLNLNEIGKFSLGVPVEAFLDQRAAFLADGPPGMGQRPWLGIFCYAMEGHVVVAGLLPDGPGEKAGLRPGDVVASVDGEKIVDRGQLYRLLWQRAPGSAVNLGILRGNRRLTVPVHAGDVVQFFA
ncbi:MAG TPA: S1C family serine protease [Candidatus Limnocylindria bacterium]|nr:S1C family serine protease [Candidatus Limnocylindria bacterium]